MAYYVFSALDANVIRGAADDPRRRQRRRTWSGPIASIDEELTALAERRADRARSSTESQQYLIGSMPRNARDQRWASRAFCRRSSSSGSASTTTSACRTCCARSRATTCTRRRAASLDPVACRGRRRRSVRRPRCDDAARRPHRAARARPGRLLRRRLHADLSRARRSRAKATRASARQSRHRRRSGRAFAAGGRRRVVDPRRGTGPHLRPRTSSCATRGASSRRWAARASSSTRCAREIYDEWAACQHFFLYDDVTPVLRELAARGFEAGPDLELAPLPRVVPAALRAARADRRRRCRRPSTAT